MSVREYLQVVVDGERQKAKTSTLLYVSGRMLSGAAFAALLLLGSDALKHPVLPVVSAQAGAVFALAMGVAAAFSALLNWRLFMRDRKSRE